MLLRTNPPVLFLAALLGAAVLLLSVQHGALAPESVTAAGSGPEMALTVRDGGFCVASDCYAATGETFQLAVDVITAPAATYIMFQTYIDFGGVSDPGASEDGAGPGTCSDGIENGSRDGRDYYDSDCTAVDILYVPGGFEMIWPEASPSFLFRSPFVHSAVLHGAISGFNPLNPSTWEGEVVSLQMSCPATPATATLRLIPNGNPYIGTFGSMFSDPDGIQITPKVNAITMHCVAPQAHPGDTDGDGCSDATEEGTDPLLGGDRSFVNPWDFYDVAGPGGANVPDGVVDSTYDLAEVIARYAPLGYPPGQGYEHYDRGPSTGSGWNDTQPPDGMIDLPNDILGVLGQVGHSCV